MFDDARAEQEGAVGGEGADLAGLGRGGAAECEQQQEGNQDSFHGTMQAG